MPEISENGNRNCRRKLKVEVTFTKRHRKLEVERTFKKKKKSPEVSEDPIAANDRRLVSCGSCVILKPDSYQTLERRWRVAPTPFSHLPRPISPPYPGSDTQLPHLLLAVRQVGYPPSRLDVCGRREAHLQLRPGGNDFNRLNMHP